MTLVLVVLVVVALGCGTASPATGPVTSPSPQIGEGGVSLIPLAPDPAFVAAARSSCLAEMVADPEIPLVVHDQRRADMAALLFENDTEYLLQIVERRQGDSYVCADGGGGSLAHISGMDLTITDWQLIGTEGSEGWLIAGHVLPNATAVRMRLGDGVELTASAASGRFVAFWFGSQKIVEMAAFDAAGREIARTTDSHDLGGGVP